MIFDFEFGFATHPSGWVNFSVQVKNWPPPPEGRKQKNSFHLGYLPTDRRWARNGDLAVAMHHPELLDQILDRYFEEPTP